MRREGMMRSKHQRIHWRFWLVQLQGLELRGSNSVWAAGQIQTSLLLLRFELENGRFESWSLHESFRPLLYLSIKINQT